MNDRLCGKSEVANPFSDIPDCPRPSGGVIFSHKQKAAKWETATIYFLIIFFTTHPNQKGNKHKHDSSYVSKQGVKIEERRQPCRPINRRYHLI